MRSVDAKEILEIAKKHFHEGNYVSAESLLGQVLISNLKSPDAYYMLGTINYDKGKFNKSVEFYKKALAVDPGFTDASVGLSILLNDLGRYDEGREVFQKAREHLELRSPELDPYIEEKFAQKHEELGSLYAQSKRHKEAIEQFTKAIEFTNQRKPEIAMKAVECLMSLGSQRKALKELKFITREFPHYLPARIYLGKLYYNLNRITDAMEQWNGVLLRDPENLEAQRYARIAQSSSLEASF
ncbi:MAG: tetratricopeptide repeat protein [Pseudomonadota bacterium]|nr:tetratricopeptide repeat protein [Pseudomonadota bacterium]